MLSMNTVIVIIIYYQPSICQATKCIFVKAFFRREAARNALFQGGNASPDLERCSAPRRICLKKGLFDALGNASVTDGKRLSLRAQRSNLGL